MKSKFFLAKYQKTLMTFILDFVKLIYSYKLQHMYNKYVINKLSTTNVAPYTAYRLVSKKSFNHSFELIYISFEIAFRMQVKPVMVLFQGRERAGVVGRKLSQSVHSRHRGKSFLITYNVYVYICDWTFNKRNKHLFRTIQNMLMFDYDKTHYLSLRILHLY